MIYALVGTHVNKRAKALEQIAKLGTPTAHIYAEQVSALLPLVEASSMFGDKIVVQVIQTLEKADTRDYVYGLLSRMKDSSNIFVFDEPFADANRYKKLEKVAEKMFDARDLSVQAGEKEGKVSPFPLCDAFARRDKKGVWVEWMKVRDEVEGEAIQGALWWKMKTVWEDTLSGRVTKFSKDDCEVFASKIMRSTLDAHRGEKDLKVELESIVLSV